MGQAILSSGDSQASRHISWAAWKKKVVRNTITKVAEVTGFVNKQLPIKYMGILLFEA